MNKRIKELIAQCTSRSDGSTWTSREEFDKEKFAELIVKECARVASDYDGAHYVGDAIEKHFGVEE
jgi:hypothetical protein